MACPNCGCRMLSTVGAGREAQLVCTDCGRPADRRALARDQRRRWQAALILGLLTVGGVLLFLLASFNEPPQEGAGAGEEAPAAEQAP